jgi:hypothetical protein
VLNEKRTLFVQALKESLAAALREEYISFDDSVLIGLLVCGDNGGGVGTFAVDLEPFHLENSFS